VATGVLGTAVLVGGGADLVRRTDVDFVRDGVADAEADVLGAGVVAEETDGAATVAPVPARVELQPVSSSTSAAKRATARRMPATLAHRVPGACAPARRLLWSLSNKEYGVGGRGGGFGGQPNMQQLMKQAQKMQQQLEAAQAELAVTEVSGTAGGGLVTATMLGSGELTALTIDPRAVDPDDVETLQDLVVAAVRDASRAVGELAADKMGPLGGGAGLGGLGIPGL
jgi:DNA-binding YbaB/EbfC family protein